MNASKHLALMLNPNLTEPQRLALVEADFRREAALVERAGEHALDLARTCGKGAAYRYLGQVLPLILAS